MNPQFATYAGLVLSAIALLVASGQAYLLSQIKVAILTMQTKMQAEQEERCNNCELTKFAGRREFDQLERRFEGHEARKAHA